MSDNTKQMKNGKAFEYAILNQYVSKFKKDGITVVVTEDDVFYNNQKCYEEMSDSDKKRFDAAAIATIDTLQKLEAGLNIKDADDPLLVRMATDSEGKNGDVRDVIFERDKAKWSIGISAKNNNDAVKHNRLSKVKDFGLSWIGYPCSDEYWAAITPIFDELEKASKNKVKWSELENKFDNYYVPVLEAFRKELLRISNENPDAPGLLITYLLGKYPFYKVIKEDKYNTVVIRAFNIGGKLNASVNGIKPKYKTPKVKLPTRIVEFDFKKRSKTTLMMILDGGWEVSFRMHSGDGSAVPSLKFDIQLTGNPPIIFTQHLFQDNKDKNEDNKPV